MGRLLMLAAPLLLRLAGQAVSTGAIIEQAAVTTRRTAADIALMLAAALMGTGAMGCAVAALWIFARPHVGPAGAPLVAAGALALVALILVLLARQKAPPPLPVARPVTHPLAPPARLVSAAYDGFLAGLSGRR